MSVPMSVLHVAAYYAPAFVYGGPPRSIHALCRALCRGGVGVRVFTTDANGSAALPRAVTEAAEYDGVPVRYFPRSWPAEPIGSRALTAAFREAVRACDLVHIHGLWNRVVWAAARESQRAGVPYVLSPRGMLQDAALAHRRWRKRLAYAAIERRTIERAAALHATAEDEAEALRRLSPQSRVVTIPNGLELQPPTRMHTRAELGLPAAGPIVAFVGRLHRIKRLDLVFDAFARVQRLRPDAHLAIAGPDEQQLRPSIETASAVPAGSVSWLGAVDADHRDSLLAHASLLLQCSDSESFGLTILEAMAAARPVVIATTCGWAELEGWGAGLRVAQNAPALAEAIGRVLADPVAAAQMGECGRRIARTTFSADAIGARMAALYGEVLEATRAQAGRRVAC